MRREIFLNGNGDYINDAVWVKPSDQFEKGLVSDLLFQFHAGLCVHIGLVFHRLDPRMEGLVLEDI